MKPLQVGLAGLYLVEAAYLVYGTVGSYQADIQPGVYAPGLLLFSAIFVGIAAFWGALGILELRGHHHQNISGSILSMIFLAAAALFEDSHIDVSEGEILLIILATAMLALIDLRELPESRTFSSVMSIDALLLIAYSLFAAYPRNFSVFATIIEDVGLLGGVCMLGLGLFWLVKPPRPLSTRA